MADCYLCGAYIERGLGYRRAVQFESSMRVYISRRGGGSYGTRTSLRTLCGTCAEIHDRVAANQGLRTVCQIATYVASAWIGWQTIVNLEGVAKWLGVLFLLGIPVAIGWHLFEKSRRRHIALEVLSSYRLDASEETDERGRPNNSSATGGRPSAFFHDTDSIISWATRIGKEVTADLRNPPHVIRQDLIDMAKVTKPRVGERVDLYRKRAIAKIEYLESVEDNPAALAIRPGEHPFDWMIRTGPLFGSLDDGLSIDDLSQDLLPAAELFPPLPSEDFGTWNDRIGPLLAEMIDC